MVGQVTHEKALHGRCQPSELFERERKNEVLELVQLANPLMATFAEMLKNFFLMLHLLLDLFLNKIYTFYRVQTTFFQFHCCSLTVFVPLDPGVKRNPPSPSLIHTGIRVSQSLIYWQNISGLLKFCCSKWLKQCFIADAV